MKTKPLALFLVAIIFQACIFSAGSYSKAIYYYIDEISNQQLVEYIKELKDKYSQYTPPDSLTEDTIDDNGFYHASFYIQKENMIIYTIINLNGELSWEKGARIGVDGILSDRKTKNAKFYQLNDLPKEKRNEVIKIFETEIFDKLISWKKI